MNASARTLLMIWPKPRLVSSSTMTRSKAAWLRRGPARPGGWRGNVRRSSRGWVRRPESPSEKLRAQHGCGWRHVGSGTQLRRLRQVCDGIRGQVCRVADGRAPSTVAVGQVAHWRHDDVAATAQASWRHTSRASSARRAARLIVRSTARGSSGSSGW